MPEVNTEPPRASRRKFAMPPVKLACLSCRASRTRCDGSRPCASCVSKSHECVYRPSRRGGPRIRKKALPESPPRPVHGPQTVDASPETLSTPFIPPPPIEIQNFVEAGAALAQLPDLPPDSDFIFDNLFMNTFMDTNFGDPSSSLTEDFTAAIPPSMPVKSGPLVRRYTSKTTLLQAYYCWIHMFVPILPPPEMTAPPDEPVPVAQHHPDGFSNNIDFNSPVALALSAVLALVPCAEDTDPNSPEAVLFRRNCAQFFAQAAIESIENDSEIPGSSIEPEKTLESTPPPIGREPFHPRVPVELESIVALNLLSIYEYAQRGNLKKMRNRAGQALVEAMMTYNLHKLGDDDDDDDFYAEAKRRIWWMTYICATQTSVVSCTTPPLELFGVSFTTKYPRLDVDPEAWPTFLASQQVMLASTEFIVHLNKAIMAKADMEPIYTKIVDLENQIAPLVAKCDAWTITGSLAPIVEPSELCLVRSLRSMARMKANSARMKVHRFLAFGDYPVFTGKMCDLQSTTDMLSVDSPDAAPSIPCMCGLMGNHGGDGSNGNGFTSVARSCHDGNGMPKAESSSPESCHPSSSSYSGGTPETVNSTAASAVSSLTSAVSGGPGGGTPGGAGMGAASQAHQHIEACRAKAPFTSHYSAKLCLQAALNMANDFDSMPYPNPSGLFGQDLCFLSPTSPIVAPRMLPSFVCCAMQGAYVFLSIYRKMVATAGANGDNTYVMSMLVQLQQGLISLLSAIENYSVAFEAMRAMSNQIRSSAEALLLSKP